jgi:hypothetical protein
MYIYPYTRCIYGIFGRGITRHTVVYGVYIRFWPTLIMHTHHKYTHTNAGTPRFCGAVPPIPAAASKQ